ncbi:hypothetical protein ACFX2B_033383 [Malus domestica]
MPSDGNKKEEEGDRDVIILCSMDVERVVSGSEVERKFTKTRSVEQRILPILGAPNVRRNASPHSILSRPRTKRYLRDWRNKMNVEFDIHSLSSFLILLQI